MLSSHCVRRRVAAPWIAALLLVAIATPARSEDQPPKPFKATGDLGYVNTAGNSDVQTLTAADKLEYTTGKWLFTQEGGAVWGAESGVENAGRYFVGLRADRSITERVSAYGLADWRRNTYAAIARQFDEGVGLVFHAIIPNPQQLDLEAGAGLTQRLNTLGEQDDFSTARVAALYRYYFKEKTYFEGNGIYLANLKNSDDYEYDARASLVAPLSGLLAVKLGYYYHFRNAPPVGFKQWDSTFAAGIQVAY